MRDGIEILNPVFEEVKSAEPLWGDRGEPVHAYHKENPRHRVIIELKATGRHTNIEIAEMVGMTPVSVGMILRQPWAEELIVKLIREHGASEREATFQLLDGLTLEAVEAQRDILRGTENEEVKRKVSNDILNRAYGTPTQRTEIVKGDDLTKLSDAEIAQRLAELKARKSN